MRHKRTNTPWRTLTFIRTRSTPCQAWVGDNNPPRRLRRRRLTGRCHTYHAKVNRRGRCPGALATCRGIGLASRHDWQEQVS